MNLYETVTSKIIEALREGVVPWKKPWHVESAIPVNAVSNKAYRGVNTLLLGLSPYTDHRWMTFKQVQERGGSIVKGEKSTMVIFWKYWQPSDQEQEESAPRGKSVPMLRYYSVFNAEQCSGLNLPELPKRHQLNENQRIERAGILVQSMPDRPNIQEGGASAWYKPMPDLVQIPALETFDSADLYYSTLFHELAHATGHQKRLNRSGVTETVHFGSSEYGREELVAEVTASFCCATVSLDNSLVNDSASYIDSWLNVLSRDPKAIVIAAAQAQKAADYIKGIDYSSN